MKALTFLMGILVAGCAHENLSLKTENPEPAQTITAPAPTNSSLSTAIRAEQIRTDCVKGRRLICGRVLGIVPAGLIVESGYTDLLRPPLTESWVVPGSATAHKDTAVLELNEPGTPCIGLVLLTDLPKRPRVTNYDYVIIMGYPAGEYSYSPAPGIEKPIRKFAAGLETAVKLKLQAEENLHGNAGR